MVVDLERILSIIDKIRRKLAKYVKQYLNATVLYLKIETFSK